MVFVIVFYGYELLSGLIKVILFSLFIELIRVLIEVKCGCVIFRLIVNMVRMIWLFLFSY